MKIWKVKMGDKVDFVVAKDYDEAFAKACLIDETYQFLPVLIEEFAVEGYVIKLTKAKPEVVAPEEVKEEVIVEEEPQVTTEAV